MSLNWLTHPGRQVLDDRGIKGVSHLSPENGETEYQQVEN